MDINFNGINIHCVLYVTLLAQSYKCMYHVRLRTVGGPLLQSSTRTTYQHARRGFKLHMNLLPVAKADIPDNKSEARYDN